MIKINFLEIKPVGKDVCSVSFTDGDASSMVLKESGGRDFRVGVHDKKEISRRKMILLIRKVVSLARSHKLKKISISFDELLSLSKIKPEDLAELFAVNAEMANFEFVKHKTPPKDGWVFVREIILRGKVLPEIKKALKMGQIIGDEVNSARELSNSPGGEMTPAKLAAAAVSASKNLKIKTTVLGKKKITALKMGGILGVSKGSKEEPKFIVMEYSGAATTPVVFIGKGVTFDTGGLNIKTGDYMYEMHMDMSGGAAVIHTICAAAKLGLKKNIIGLIPAVENMPSGESYRPGDILKSMSGKTIEVINTDAEGRIILADAITYAKKFNPSVVIDVATLTGAAVAALGERASAIFSRDEKLIDKFMDYAETSGDYVWPLPLWDEYEDEVKGVFGDVANASKSRYGGAINGAMFLYQFAKELKCPWLHIDMAPRMTSVEGEFLAKGAAGVPVRLLTEMLKS